MKIVLPCAAMILVVASLLVGQTQGPLKDPGATVARPRKNPDSTTGNDEELPKIPSKLKKDPQMTKGTDVAQFKADVDIVTVDVAVIDNKGHFIPGIPPGNFRLLEDNVPQQLRKVDMGEAPMTIALVIEFSNLFQRYWSARVVSDPAVGLGLRRESEAGGLRRGSRVRYPSGDSDRFHHRQDENPRRPRPSEDRRVLRSEYVRRGHRHRRSHERNRRA